MYWAAQLGHLHTVEANLVLKAWGILGELPFFSKYCQAVKLVSDVSAG